jgi:TPR repeat protein
MVFNFEGNFTSRSNSKQINKIQNIEIHYPENNEEVKRLGFGYLSTFSFFGNTLLVINSQSDWGYFLRSVYDAETQKWEYICHKRNEPENSLKDFEEACKEINSLINSDILSYLNNPLPILLEMLDNGCKDASLYWKLGEVYRKKSQFKEAYLYYLNAANMGNMLAQFELAELYSNPDSSFYNLNEAVKWHQKAAISGCQESMFWLGKFYYEPENACRNVLKAIQYLESLDNEYDFGDGPYMTEHCMMQIPIMLEYLYKEIGNNEKSDYYRKKNETIFD